MAWSTTVVHREKLYDEVWTEPVVKVAKRYGVSDVALRKVCVKLSVPVPPLGHWAKLAHGKPTSRPRLPPLARAQQHVFQRWVAPVDEELETRLAEAYAERAEVQVVRQPAGIAAQTNRSSWHRTVKRTASAVRNEFQRLPDSWRIAKGPGHFSLYTSKEGVERALSMLDLLVQLCVASAFETVPATDEDLPARVFVEGHAYTFRIVERATRGERELTASERSALLRDKGAYVPNRITKQGTNQLRLEVLNTAGYPVLSRSDTRHQRLDDVLYEVPAALHHHAVEQSVREALGEERAERAEADRRRRQALIDVKNEQLTRLEETEKAAHQWVRARRLYRYAQALYARARADETSIEERQRLLVEAQWTERAAGWMDPLTRQHWPEVDDAPSSVYE